MSNYESEGWTRRKTIEMSASLSRSAVRKCLSVTKNPSTLKVKLVFNARFFSTLLTKLQSLRICFKRRPIPSEDSGPPRDPNPKITKSWDQEQCQIRFHRHNFQGTYHASCNFIFGLSCKLFPTPIEFNLLLPRTVPLPPYAFTRIVPPFNDETPIDIKSEEDIQKMRQSCKLVS